MFIFVSQNQEFMSIIKKHIKKYTDFSVGDKVRITKRPSRWSGVLNNNYPLNLSFPLEITIQDLAETNCGTITMTCGDYGWALSKMIEENCIEKINKSFSWVSPFKSEDQILKVKKGKYYALSEICRYSQSDTFHRYIFFHQILLCLT